MGKERAVFLDRDGTLVKNVSYGNEVAVAARKTEDLELFPEIQTVLKNLHDAGFLLVVVSNQPDIALGKIDEPTRVSLEKRFEELIKEKGLPIDDIYYCHHHPKGVVARYTVDCECKKPKPGMLLWAAEKWNIDLENSWMIGDTYKDINAGNAVGCQTILVENPWSQRQNCQPGFTVDKLEQSLDIILDKAIKSTPTHES